MRFFTPISLSRLSLFAILPVFLTILIIFARYISVERWQDSDFRIFYAASRILRKDPAHLYDFKTQLQEQQSIGIDKTKALAFVNPPIALLPYVPLSMFPPIVAYHIYMLILFALYLFCICALQRFFHHEGSMYQLLLLLTFTPFYFLLIETQNAIWFLLLLIGFLYAMRKKKYLLSSSLLALCWYKPQLAFLVTLYFFIKGPKKLRVGLLLSIIFFIIINLFLCDFSWQTYIKTFLWYATVFESTFERTSMMISWQGILSPLEQYFPHLPSYSISFLGSIATFVISILVSLRCKNKDEELLYGVPVLITGTLLGGMHMHYHHGILLIYLFYRFYQKPFSKCFITLVIAGWIIFLLSYFSPCYPKPLPYFPGIYILILWILCIREAIKIKPFSSKKKEILDFPSSPIHT